LGQDYWVKDEISAIASLDQAGFSAYAEPLVQNAAPETALSKTW
jgi:hypothetical protein